MSKKDFFKDACCNNISDNYVNDNLNISYLWALIIFVIFMGVPFGKDCFWNGYCNAFDSSAFSCGNYNNTISSTNPNFSNATSTTNTDSFFSSI